MEKSTSFLLKKMEPNNLTGISKRKKDDLKRLNIHQWLTENLMLLATLAGVVSGACIGFALRPLQLSSDALVLISYPGEMFMRILKLMILPLIIASLISGSASLNAKLSGKIAIRTLIYFLLTSLFNALFGVILVVMIHPGQSEVRENYHPEDDVRKNNNILDSMLDLGRNIIPDNLFQATLQQAHTAYINQTGYFGSKNMTELTRVVVYRSGTNTVGIVFFCLIFGSLLGGAGPKGKIVVDFFQVIFEIVMKIVSGIMWCSPVGVASIIVGKILAAVNVGLIISQLGWFIMTIAIGIMFYQLVIMQLIYFVFIRRNPYKFYCGLSQATLTAFATASTAAALPISLRLMEQKLRVDPRVTRFVLPVGCNINMDGTALFVAVAAVFIAQLNQIELGVGELATVVITSTIASASSASVPSTALVILLMVLAAIDTPPQDVSLLFAVDWFVDRIRTTNNMLGDCYAAAVVEQLSKKELESSDMESPDPERNISDHMDVEAGTITSTKSSLTLDCSANVIESTKT